MSSRKKFEYNAPTYVDFMNTMDESTDVDNFFDVPKQPEESKDNNPSFKNKLSDIVYFTPDKQSTPNRTNDDSNDDNETLLDQENLNPKLSNSCKTPNTHNGRRSRILFEALDDLCLTGSVKTHKMLTRKDPRTPLLELRGRSVPRNVNFLFDQSKPLSKVCREILFETEADQLAHQIQHLSVCNSEDPQPIIEKVHAEEQHSLQEIRKETNNSSEALEPEVSGHENVDPNETVTIKHETLDARKRKSNVLNSPTIENTLHENKYISLAESALKFHGGFRAPLKFTKKFTNRLTIPKTPNLQTKTRTRPNNVLSQAEKEEKLLEEMKDNQPKANPVPKGLFNSPKLGIRKSAISKKPFTNTTVNLSMFNKNGTKPVSYSTNQNCVKVIETDQTGLKVTNKELAHRGVSHCKYKQKPVKPQPFSFYLKDVERYKQKEEKIKKIIEDERKQHEVHANPLPRYVQKARRRVITSSQNSLNSTSCSHSTTCSSSKNYDNFVFKAKPPTVLHQKPFIPKKSMKPCSQIENFILHTEERSQQREVFENHKKQKELENQLHLLELKREQEEQEAIEFSVFRKSLVHKPLPIPKTKPCILQNVKGPLTYPESPNFSK